MPYLNSYCSATNSGSLILPVSGSVTGSTTAAPSARSLATAMSSTAPVAAPAGADGSRQMPSRAPSRAAGSRACAKEAGPVVTMVRSAESRSSNATGSSGSAAASTDSSAAASATQVAIGPAVSWTGEMGTMPRRLTRPLVGLRPTMPQALAGHTIEPSVSVPTASGASAAATPAAEPELDPDGLRSSAYGLAVWPPRVDQPLVECVDR